MALLFFVVGVVVVARVKLKREWQTTLDKPTFDEYEVYYNECD
jgi:hypothetical protein